MYGQILTYTFIEALAQLYPCHLCARHFRAAIDINPPRYYLVCAPTACNLRVDDARAQR